MKRDRHIPQLDGLRGVAILLVLSLHTLGGTAAQGVFGAAMNVGWIGVDLFFVLSGFLITRILLEAKGSDHYFRNFYTRRALRIWPLYYIVLLFAIHVVPYLDPQLRLEVDRGWWIPYAFFIQNLAPAAQFGPWPVQVTWSLAIEEQFYLLWPVLVWALNYRSLRRFLLIVIAGVPLLRLASLLAGVTPLAVYIVTPFRIDALACGALAAVLMNASSGAATDSRVKQACRQGFWLLPVALGLTVFIVAGDELIVATGSVSRREALALAVTFSMFAIGFMGLLMFVIERPAARATELLAFAPLRYVGMVSFGLYLYHGLLIPLFNFYARPVLSQAAGHGVLAWIANLVVFYALLFALAHLSWRLIEQPILNFKRRFA